jgi:hypothetical protein
MVSMLIWTLLYSVVSVSMTGREGGCILRKLLLITSPQERKAHCQKPHVLSVTALSISADNIAESEIWEKKIWSAVS